MGLCYNRPKGLKETVATPTKQNSKLKNRNGIYSDVSHKIFHKPNYE